jgi:DMSO/TMAO reductase YedYZ molybdopterin-dependent catalytic subunit
MDTPNARLGALAGALLTLPLLAALFLARQLVGLPFVPFDLFDWLTRQLPGALITSGIDAMVATVRGLDLGETSRAAKRIEQSLAIVGFVVAGTIVGALFFAGLQRSPRRTAVGIGAAVGAVLGLIGGVLTAAALPSAIWMLVALAAWGAALGWSWDRLARPVPVPGEMRERWAALGERIGRRDFLLRLGGAAVGLTVAGTGIGVMISNGRGRTTSIALGRPWSATHPLPNAGAAVQPVPGTRPELTPVGEHYRVDIDTRAPQVDEATWRLALGGLVEQPLELPLAALRERFAPTDQFVTLACISNPLGGDLTGTTRWTGVSLQTLLAELRPLPSASHLKIRSADGFYETVALAAIRADPRIMLTYAWDGLPLPAEHGFPLRIYIPDLYGMKQPKWIESIEAIDHYEPGYWVDRGWDRIARMNATSVIDTIGEENRVSDAERTAGTIPIGGMAHAGARGISRVEVQVDDGPWEEAELREPISPTTWTLWRYAWPYQRGRHTFTVRCFEADGTPQITLRSPPHPSGATGLFSRQKRL